jgi:hypothetical protein
VFIIAWLVKHPAGGWGRYGLGVASFKQKKNKQKQIDVV